MARWSWVLGGVLLCSAVDGTAPPPAKACSCVPRRELRKLPRDERPPRPDAVFLGRLIATDEIFGCDAATPSENLGWRRPADARPAPTGAACVTLDVRGSCGQPLVGAVIAHPRGGLVESDANGIAVVCGVVAHDVVRVQHSEVYARVVLDARTSVRVTLESPGPDRLRHEFLVIAAARGARPRARVWINSTSGSCGFHPEPGRAYEVRARREADGALWSGTCSRSRALWPTARMEDRRRRRARRRWSPDPASPYFGPSW